MSGLLLALLAILIVAALIFHRAPYGRRYGYYPAGGFGLLLVIVLLLIVFHVI